MTIETNTASPSLGAVGIPFRIALQQNLFLNSSASPRLGGEKFIEGTPYFRSVAASAEAISNSLSISRVRRLSRRCSSLMM